MLLLAAASLLAGLPVANSVASLLPQRPFAMELLAFSSAAAMAAAAAAGMVVAALAAAAAAVSMTALPGGWGKCWIT